MGRSLSSRGWLLLLWAVGVTSTICASVALVRDAGEPVSTIYVATATLVGLGVVWIIVPTCILIALVYSTGQLPWIPAAFHILLFSVVLLIFVTVTAFTVDAPTLVSVPALVQAIISLFALHRWLRGQTAASARVLTNYTNVETSRRHQQQHHESASSVSTSPSSVSSTPSSPTADTTNVPATSSRATRTRAAADGVVSRTHLLGQAYVTLLVATAIVATTVATQLVYVRGFAALSAFWSVNPDGATSWFLAALVLVILGAVWIIVGAIVSQWFCAASTRRRACRTGWHLCAFGGVMIVALTLLIVSVGQLTTSGQEAETWVEANCVAAILPVPSEFLNVTFGCTKYVSTNLTSVCNSTSPGYDPALGVCILTDCCDALAEWTENETASAGGAASLVVVVLLVVTASLGEHHNSAVRDVALIRSRNRKRSVSGINTNRKRDYGGSDDTETGSLTMQCQTPTPPCPPTPPCDNSVPPCDETQVCVVVSPHKCCRRRHRPKCVCGAVISICALILTIIVSMIIVLIALCAFHNFPPPCPPVPPVVPPLNVTQLLELLLCDCQQLTLAELVGLEALNTTGSNGTELLIDAPTRGVIPISTWYVVGPYVQALFANDTSNLTVVQQIAMVFGSVNQTIEFLLNNVLQCSSCPDETFVYTINTLMMRETAMGFATAAALESDFELQSYGSADPSIHVEVPFMFFNQTEEASFELFGHISDVNGNPLASVDVSIEYDNQTEICATLPPRETPDNEKFVIVPPVVFNTTTNAAGVFEIVGDGLYESTFCSINFTIILEKEGCATAIYMVRVSRRDLIKVTFPDGSIGFEGALPNLEMVCGNQTATPAPVPCGPGDGCAPNTTCINVEITETLPGYTISFTSANCTGVCLPGYQVVEDVCISDFDACELTCPSPGICELALFDEIPVYECVVTSPSSSSTGTFGVTGAGPP